RAGERSQLPGIVVRARVVRDQTREPLRLIGREVPVVLKAPDRGEGRGVGTSQQVLRDPRELGLELEPQSDEVDALVPSGVLSVSRLVRVVRAARAILVRERLGSLDRLRQ